MNLLTVVVLSFVHRLIEPIETRLRAARSLMDTLVVMRTEELQLLSELEKLPASVDAAEEAVLRAEEALAEYRISPLADMAECASRPCQRWAGACEHAAACTPLQVLLAARNAYGIRKDLDHQLDVLRKKRDAFRRNTGL